MLENTLIFFMFMVAWPLIFCMVQVVMPNDESVFCSVEDSKSQKATRRAYELKRLPVWSLLYFCSALLVWMI
jgi:hypothetical protein